MPEDMSTQHGMAPGEAQQHQQTAEPTRQGSAGGADAPRSEGGAGDVVARAELNKVVAQRQAAKEKARQLTGEMEQLLARLREMPDEQEVRAFQEWKSRGQAGEGAGPEADVEAIERRLRQPLEADLEQLRGRRAKLETQLTQLLRDQQLRIAAARANAINPEQVVGLLRDRVRMVEGPDGRFVPEFLDDSGEVLFDGPRPTADAERFVALFLARPDSANLVRSTVTPGSGARQAGGLSTSMDTMPRTKAEFLSLPADKRLAIANRMTRLQRDALLGRGSPDGGGYL